MQPSGFSPRIYWIRHGAQIFSINISLKDSAAILISQQYRRQW